MTLTLRAHDDPSKISQFVLKVTKILKRSENCLSIGLYCSIYVRARVLTVIEILRHSNYVLMTIKVKKVNLSQLLETARVIL